MYLFFTFSNASFKIFSGRIMDGFGAEVNRKYGLSSLLLSPLTRLGLTRLLEGLCSISVERVRWSLNLSFRSFFLAASKVSSLADWVLIPLFIWRCSAFARFALFKCNWKELLVQQPYTRSIRYVFIYTYI